MIYDFCNEMWYILREKKEDGDKKESCALVSAVKEIGYSSPDEKLKRLNGMGCPDTDCSCKYNTGLFL